jgi:NAD(P)-dependent dehydrogenase (short-subunit alcohol dehydrogenase family)
MSLEGKTAIITGGGRNIGEETCRLFAQNGANVAVVDLGGNQAERVARSIAARGGSARPFVADVSDEDQVTQLMSNIVHEFGRVDILINNVAISDNKDMLEISLTEWNRILAVTLTSPFIVGRAFARRVIEQNAKDDRRGGVILNIGSTSGYYGRSRAIAYTAAKGGVINLTRSMAIQLASYNIRVCLAVPNKIGSPVGKAEFDDTRPVVNLRGNRPGMPADMAKALLFLASDDADFVTGTALFVDGGVTTIMPS